MTSNELEKNSIIDEESDTYVEHWDPMNYLNAFYSESTINSKRIQFFCRNVAEILSNHYENVQGKRRVLEFGAGATLWPSFLLSLYFDEIWFCDYMLSNLECVQNWLDKKNDSFNWKSYFDFLLPLQKTRQGDEPECEEKLRLALKNGKIFQCDIRSKELLFLGKNEPTPEFDMIITIGCLESGCSTHLMLDDTIHRLASLLKPNGLLLILTYRNSKYYRFNGCIYEDLPIDEECIRNAFARSAILTEPISKSIDIESQPDDDTDGLMINYGYRKAFDSEGPLIHSTIGENIIDI